MIRISGSHFMDESGRSVMLRGVNLGGSSKLPTKPDGATWRKDRFYDHRNVSFVGRPFPLNEADVHYSRLRACGFNCLRFLITWEAIEHAGPGIHDQEYLQYLYEVVKKAGEFGFYIFIDPHQDVWSRFSGGDGAPGWTLEAAGFDVENIHKAGAAILHQEWGDPFPRMIWPTNDAKLAAATMFTLFFGGNDFAPGICVDGIPIQDFLQKHYMDAVKQAAMALKDLPNVIGYDSLNEPSSGYIGHADIRKYSITSPVQIDATPTVLQGMALGSGIPQEVDVYEVGMTGFRKKGKKVVNSEGAPVWISPQADIWRNQGLWNTDKNGNPVALIPDYFSKVNGRNVNFNEDYFKPFVNRFAHEIRSISPEAIIFTEGVPGDDSLTWTATDAPHVVHAAHWYDGYMMFKKSFTPRFSVDSQTRKISLGKQNVRKSFVRQIQRIINHSKDKMNNIPTLIGEVGIPFDMQSKRAYSDGNFHMQRNGLDAVFNGLEGNCACFTLWTYTADNSNERGDLWNDEDFSIFSVDQMTGSGDITDGIRIPEVIIRPYPRKVAGDPVNITYDYEERVFTLEFIHKDTINDLTEIFLPAHLVGNIPEVFVSDGSYSIDVVKRTLLYQHENTRNTHRVSIKFK